MFKTKRKRAVVLALIAFFCTAAVTYVAVDWKRFGGGFLAFFKGGKGDPAFALAGGSSGSKAGQMAAGDNIHSNAPALPQLVAVSSRKHASGFGGGAKAHPSDDDLFKYGDPAAGGIPAGSFTVAQNDTPGGGVSGFGPGAGAPAEPETGSPASSGGEGGGPGVSSPAPAPAGTGAPPEDGGVAGGGSAAPPPPAATPPAGSPPATTPPPAPAPNQSGTTDNPPAPPVDAPPPSLPPVSAVPEASSLAMMGLGALFLAVAASRKRKQA